MHPKKTSLSIDLFMRSSEQMNLIKQYQEYAKIPGKNLRGTLHVTCQRSFQKYRPGLSKRPAAMNLP